MSYSYLEGTWSDLSWASPSLKLTLKHSFRWRVYLDIDKFWHLSTKTRGIDVAKWPILVVKQVARWQLFAEQRSSRQPASPARHMLSCFPVWSSGGSGTDKNHVVLACGRLRTFKGLFFSHVGDLIIWIKAWFILIFIYLRIVSDICD